MHQCHKTLGDVLVEQVWHLWIVTTSRDTKVAVTYGPFYKPLLYYGCTISSESESKQVALSQAY